MPESGKVITLLENAPVADDAPVTKQDVFPDAPVNDASAIASGQRKKCITDDAVPAKWPAPQELTTNIKTDAYPLEHLPEEIRGAIEEVQSFVQAPVSLVAASALSAISLAAQAYIDSERDKHLKGPVGLFFLTIADSGERKSSCDGYFSSAIKDYERAEAIKAKPVIQDYEADMKAWSAKSKGLEEKIRQLSKEGKPTSAQASDLRSLEREKPEPPMIPRLYYSDVTPEALGFYLATKWPSGGIVSSEAGSVFGSHGMGKDSAMRNFAMLNQLWDGGTINVDRRTSESFVVRGARLTMALQVQEPVLREFFSATGETARGSGFLARFLLSLPDSTQGSRPFKESPAEWPKLAKFNQRITEILSEPAPINDDGALKPDLMRMTKDAKELWVAYHDETESLICGNGALSAIRDVASKVSDNVARLAALLAKFEGRTEINAKSLESAVYVVAWHLNESLGFLGGMALPAEMADAARVDKWVIDYCKTERTGFVSKRHVQQFGPVQKKERFHAAINELANLDRLDVRKDGKKIFVHVNPALLAAV